MNGVSLQLADEDFGNVETGNFGSCWIRLWAVHSGSRYGDGYG